MFVKLTDVGTKDQVLLNAAKIAFILPSFSGATIVQLDSGAQVIVQESVAEVEARAVEAVEVAIKLAVIASLEVALAVEPTP